MRLPAIASSTNAECFDAQPSARHGLLRVFDESGEDYLYPAEFFAPVEVPEEAEQVLASGQAAAGLRRH